MKKNTPKSELDINLRKKAEELLKNRKSLEDSNLSDSEILKLIHELDVHQIELEMQNEELKKSNKLAELASDKYTNLYDFAPSGYYVLSVTGEIIDLNLMGARFLGKERSLLMKHKFAFFVADEDKNVFGSFLDKVFASEIKVNCELKLIVNGTTLYINLSGITSENKNQCLVTAVDITENKINEEKIKLTEEKYQTIFDNDRDSITIFRINNDGKLGNIIEANEATTTIFGYSKKELLSLSVYDLEKVSKKTRAERLNTIKLEGRIDFETAIKTKKGNYRDVEVQVVLINFLNAPAIMNVTRDITERKQMENNIKKAYENLATILEAIPDLLFEVDLDGRIYHYQSHSDDFLAAPPEVFMGKLLQEILPAEATNVILEALKEADEKNWSIGKQYSLELPNGKFWFELSVSSINYGKDEVKHFIALARNITERKLAEEALKENEEKLRGVFNVAHSGIVMTDCHGKLLMFNNWWRETLGYTEEEMKGLTNLTLTHPDDVEESKNLFNKITEGQIDRFQIEKRYIRKDKSFFWGEVSVSPIKDINNKVVSTIGIIIDITERKKAEIALAESEEKLKVIFNSVTEAIYLMDETGTFVDINKGAEKMYQYTREEFIGKNPSSVAAPGLNNLEDIQNKMQSVLKTGIPVQFEFWAVRKNGEIFPKDVVINKGKYNGKDVLITTARDITEHKKAELQLLNAKEEADRSREYLDNIINNMGDPVFVKDDQSRILVVNEALCKIFGMKKQDIIGKTLAEDVGEKERESFFKIDKQVLHDGIENINEETLTIRGGKPSIISTRKTRFIDANGQKYLVGVIHDISKRKENERILQESENFLKQTQLIAQLGYYTLDIETGKWTSSVVLDSIFGIDSNYEKCAKGWKPIIHPEWLETVANYFNNEVFVNKSDFEKEFKIIRQDDHTERWIHALGELQFNDKNEPIKMIGTIRDITERKDKFEELEKLNRVLSLNSQINDLILRTNNRETLFEEVCKIAVNYGKFRMSWIGILNEVTNEISPATWYGFEDDYLKQIKKITIDKVPEGMGPTGKAMREGKVFVSNDIANDPIMKPWRKQALQRGYQSSISLPIIVRNKTTTIFTLYSEEANFFKSEREIELLVKITDNIAFSLETILLEEERKLAEVSLIKTNSYLENLINYANAPIIVWDPKFKITRFNHTFELLTGRTEADVIGKSLDLLFPTKQIKDSMSKIKKTKSGERWNAVEMDIMHLDHSVRTVLWNSATIFNPDDNTSLATIAQGQDITERKQAEERFRELVDSTGGIVWEADASTFNFNYVSKQAERLLGYSTEDWYTPGFWAAHIHPDDRKKTVDYCLLQTKQKLDHDFIYRFISKKGKAVWLRDIVNVIVEDGKPRWLRGVMLDISLQKENEESLRESEEKYRGLVENSPDAVVIYLEGKIVYVNEEGIRMVGAKNAKEIIGKTVLEFVHPDSLESIIKRMEEVTLDNNSSEIIEEKCIDMEGKTIDVEIKAIPTFFEHKPAVQVIVHDITMRKQSLLELNKMNRVYSLISQINNLIIRSKNREELLQEICRIAVVYGKFRMSWIGMVDNDRKSVNTAAFYGAEDGYLTKNNTISILNEPNGNGPIGTSIRERRTITCNNIATDPIMERWRERSIKRGYHSSISIPIVVLTKVIGSFNLYSEETNTFSSEEEVELLEKITQNIAFTLETIIFEEDRIKTQVKIKQLSQAVEQSPVTIVITNTNGDIEYVNPKFIETTGYSYEEVIGHNPRILKSGTTTQEEYKLLWQTLSEGNEWHGEFHNMRKDGELYWESASISPILNEQGKITHFIAIKEDVTNRKIAEKELIIAKEKAEESDRLKLAFLANMSHEIRTPMNGILGFTELLKVPHISGEEQREYIEIIEKSGKRMLNIINDIISISKVESGQIEITLSETNVNDQIHYLHTFFKPETKQKGIQLNIAKELASKDTLIKTDKEKLYAILTNLVKNAIKFTNEGSIEFGCEKKEGMLEFFVKDSGLGIPNSKKEIIFERFRQVNDTVSRSHEGSGLGLAISRAYVEMLGGKIWVESEVGKGSSFYFTIPFQSEYKTEKENSAEKENSGIKEENKIKDLKVLIVEDDAISKLLVTIAVKPYSKEILKVSTGIEAIAVCRNNPDIDLVLMDINMPEMGGYEATQKIREFNKDLIIIAQTANGMQSDRDDAIASGCTDYISKPVNLISLSELIQKYFKK